MNLTFREMKPEDADAVEAVEQACFAIPWSRESFWKEAANENTCYLLALDGEQVIGYAAAGFPSRRRRSRTSRSLRTIAVRRSARASWRSSSDW